MKVEVLSREFIKPNTPTPLSLQKYSISLVDELSPAMNFPIILYYAADPETSSSRCERLKKSMSKVLPRFYPFAGRYMKDSFMVDCSDQGVEFVEAKVDVRLDDLVGQAKNLEAGKLTHLIPRPIRAADEITDPLLAVQITSFACGGWAIGLMSAHRIADMSTTSSFLNEWAIAAKVQVEGSDGGHFPTVSPIWDSASLFPGKKMSGPLSGSARKRDIVENHNGPLSGSARKRDIVENHNIVTKVFSFNNLAISRVRENVRLDNSSKRLPTRVQSVFGIIGKSILDIHAARSKELLVLQAVNMRGRTVPPISKNQCGCLCLLATTLFGAGEIEVELHNIVDLLMDTVERELEKCKMILSPEGQTMISNAFHELAETHAKPNIAALGFSDWCKFPFYEADFGLGKPFWISSAELTMANTVILVSDKFGEGVEAWVNLNSDDMLRFEQDSNIMEYST